MIPRRGAIAVCSAGCLGIITSSEPQEIAYGDGSRALAWTGIHLTDNIGMGHRIGSHWSSRNPEVQGYAEDITESLLYTYNAREIVEAVFPKKCLAAREVT